MSGASDRLSGWPDAVSGIPDARRRDLASLPVACRLRWRDVAMEQTPRACRSPARCRRAALLVAIVSTTACATSARGPPRLTVDIALERARQALCTAGGIESPRALVAALVPEAPCRQPEAEARVRCYLAARDTAMAVRRIAGGFRVRVAIPSLSDHVHVVTVHQAVDGSIEVAIDSAN